jgi:hypothetical protein
MSEQRLSADNLFCALHDASWPVWKTVHNEPSASAPTALPITVRDLAFALTRPIVGSAPRFPGNWPDLGAHRSCIRAGLAPAAGR